MGNLGGYNAEQYEPNSFDAIPKGDYVVMITESEMKPTKAGNGAYLALKLQVADGQYKGRVVFANLNIQNPSQQAQKIGLGELSAICRACGKLHINDSSELHGIAFKARIGIEPDQNGNERNKLVATLWKETTKPDLGAFAAPAKAGTDDDLPDFLK